MGLPQYLNNKIGYNWIFQYYFISVLGASQNKTFGLIMIRISIIKNIEYHDLSF